jgi:hypothetical protein
MSGISIKDALILSDNVSCVIKIVDATAEIIGTNIYCNIKRASIKTKLRALYECAKFIFSRPYGLGTFTISAPP